MFNFDTQVEFPVSKLKTYVSQCPSVTQLDEKCNTLIKKVTLLAVRVTIKRSFTYESLFTVE